MRHPEAFHSSTTRYRRVDQLGQGGAGVVFKVLDEDDQPFALKCLVPERATRERRKRFKNELEFCSRKIHRNIVQVVDHGTLPTEHGDSAFYVMPLYQTTLRGILAEGGPQ